MSVTPLSKEELARRKAAREQADRAYNDALTAVDAAVLQMPALPGIPGVYDESQMGALNERWNIVPEGAALPASGWKRLVAAALWRLVGPVFHRQAVFNSLVVDHLNRNVHHQRSVRESVARLTDVLRDQLGALAAFETRLMILLQQVTPYVNTKDEEVVTLAFEHGLVGAVNSLADELRMRAESMQAHERRFEARVTGLTTAHADLQAALATLHQATAVLKREVARLAEQSGTAALAQPTPGAQEGGGAPATAAGPAGALDSYKYVGFEDRFRGSQAEIRARLEDYVPLFEGASDVLDLGCGRGEFLDLLRESGISGRGLDLNHEMVEVCRSRGLRVDEGDALSFLRALPDGALGGLLAAQVVEHLEPDYLLALLDVAYAKLRPGSRIVLETINPACWFAFFESYIRDITHVRPLHPDTLSYLLTASGFQEVSVSYRAPYPEHEKLQTVPGDDDRSETFNANVERLNRLLFTHLDYAAMGRRL